MSGANSHPRTMSKGAIIGASTVLVVAVVAAVCVVSFKNSSGGGNEDGELSTSVKSVKAFCQPMDYKETCEAELSKVNGGKADSPTELAKAIFEVTKEKINKAVSESATLEELKNDKRTSGALQNCKELLEYAIDDLHTSFEKLGGFEMTNFNKAVDDLRTWLSAALTYQETCLDGFMNTTTDASAKMRGALNASQELTEDILAVVDQFSATLGSLSIGRRLLGEDDAPLWMTDGRRHLMEAEPSSPEFKPNVTVAADGSGDFKTINEALAKVPPKSAATYVMYIKAGTYKEYVSVPRTVTNLVMIGDGAAKTVVTGNKNFMMNLTTKDTATMEAIGNGFFMKNIRVENTAGAANHQAVALRVQSDQAVFYQCYFDGYQDTLYTHAQRQFFRDCTITGTIDFIFGNSQVVIQNCLIQPRKPMDNQVNIITAQGRREKRSAGGTVLHNCTVEPHPDFVGSTGKIATYLARPWKEYSRTIYIQNDIGGFIDPKGWLEWNGNFGLETLFYAEVENHGAGADMSKRAKWGGIKTVTYEQAQKEYTVEAFIQGQQFIPKYGVPFIPGLLPQSEPGRGH